MGDFLAYRNACLRDTMTREWLENSTKRGDSRERLHNSCISLHKFQRYTYLTKKEMNFGLSNRVIETCDHALVVRRVVGKCPKAACLPCP
jgi:hypothetical protein